MKIKVSKDTVSIYDHCKERERESFHEIFERIQKIRKDQDVIERQK